MQHDGHGQELMGEREIEVSLYIWDVTVYAVLV